jgi:hypothetical protein
LNEEAAEEIPPLLFCPEFPVPVTQQGRECSKFNQLRKRSAAAA